MADQSAADEYFRIEITRRMPADEMGREVFFYARHPLKAEKPRFAREKDIREAFLILVNLAVARAVPQRYWPGWCHFVAGVRFRKHLRKHFPSFAESLASVTGERDLDRMQALFRASRDARHRRLMLLCAELADARWQPNITLGGADGLRRALDRGRGAIVWCGQFTAQNLIGKRALHEGGFRCHQVSVSEHGFSDSAFAMRFLNPLPIRVENRYLEERVVFGREDTFQVAKRISEILRRNGVVLMTNNVYSGSAFAETPLGISGHQQFASAPVNFAARGGAALFAMSTFETTAFERYQATISPEIDLGRPDNLVAQGRSTARTPEVIARALLQVADFMLADLRRFPEQYMLWRQAKSVIEEASDTRAVDSASPQPKAV